jgi:GDP-L-fucose synthase
VIGYGGKFHYDKSKPDGMPRKLLDVARLSALGWSAQTSLTDGIRQTYAWYLEHRAGEAA